MHDATLSLGSNDRLVKRQKRMSDNGRDSLTDNSVRPCPQRRSLIVGLVLINGLVWLLAFIFFHKNSLLLGAAGLSYGLGLRHALDADHIAVIDNVTRAALREKREARAAGLFFSLGHSTIVCLATLIVVLAGQRYHTQIDAFAVHGGLFGTWVSALFLCMVALINALTFRDLWRRRSGRVNNAPRGLSRVLEPVMRQVSVSWHLYPIGFLFGLGFDTASEISLLGISIVQGEHGLPVWEIMMFPLLFTAGMALLDTADSMLMHGLYKRAERGAACNLALTLASVMLAFVIALIEITNLFADKLHGLSMLTDFAVFVSGHFEIIGAFVFGASVIGWIWLKPELEDMRGNI